MTLEVYLFALFNEDLKPGPTLERSYGLYQPDGTMCLCTYVGLSAQSSKPDGHTSSAIKGKAKGSFFLINISLA